MSNPVTPPEEVAIRQKLTRQLNHRLKNDIQWIALLLEFQQASAPAPAANALGSAAQRLRSIAGIYGLRANSDNGAVAITLLLNNILRETGQTQGVQAQLQVAPDAYRHAIQDANILPISLILKEITHNAITHSQGETPPQVTARTEAGHLTITVTNAGMLPSMFDAERQTGLGVGLDLALAMAQILPGLQLGFASDSGWVTATLTISASHLTLLDTA